MDVKAAVALAKKHIAELFEDDQVSNIGLEEVEYLEEGGIWLVTVGFSRPWDVEPPGPLSPLSELLSQPRRVRRDMKVVRIKDATERVLSVKNRE